MAIERFRWTDHAELRLEQRGLARSEVEDAIRESHEVRERNLGDAEWRVDGQRADGRMFVAIYDHPVEGDEGLVRIVSVWMLRAERK